MYFHPVFLKIILTLTVTKKKDNLRKLLKLLKKSARQKCVPGSVLVITKMCKVYR